MRHPLFPLLLLVLAPLAYLAWRRGVARRGRVLWGLAGVAALILLAGIRAGGVDFVYLKRMKLWVAGVTALVCLLRGIGVPWLRGRRHYLATLAAIAAFAWAVFFNFFTFHGASGGRPIFVHLHDVAHYYLGAKYFPELGYGTLYVAMLRAEAERYDNHFRSIEVRDLRNNSLVHIRALLARSDPVKARFSRERWRAFEEDVGFFHEALGPQYGEILRDHGFNPTPAWVLLGYPLANLVPAGSRFGIRLLTFLDPLLLVGVFAALAWAFGFEAALLSMIYFCVLYGASFGWTGGAFLRYPWFFGVVVSLCCLRRRHYFTAGGLLAWATLLRIFPVFFLAGIGGKAVRQLLRRRRPADRYRRVFVGFAATGVVLAAATILPHGGFDHWRGFSTNIQRHLTNNAYNTFGLTEILAYRGPRKPDTAEAFARDLTRRRAIHLGQLLVAVPLVLFMLLRNGRHRSDVELTAMSILLLFASLGLASYYYAFLVLLVPACRRDPGRLTLLFAIEAATYSLLLFEDREIVLYFYRNVLIAYLLLGLIAKSHRARAAGSGPLDLSPAARGADVD